MALSRPTLEDGQSQIISNVDFSEWLPEDLSAPGSPDSDFDELFRKTPCIRYVEETPLCREK